MQSIAELNEKILELTKQRDEAIAGERKAIIQEINKQIKIYSLTANDLGFGKEKDKQPKKTAMAVAIKYKKGDLTWSGGRGRKPEWVKEILDSKGDIEKYRVA